MAKFYLFAYNLVCAGGWAYVLFLVAQAFMAAGGVPKAILDAGTYRRHPPIDGARPPRKKRRAARRFPRRTAAAASRIACLQY